MPQEEEEPAGNTAVQELYPASSTQATTAYSHGFESIYAIETVDISTVRPLSQATPATPTKPSRAIRSAPPSTDYLDFGDQWPWVLDPICLYEPIEMLGLSAQCYKGLAAAGKHRLSDLYCPRTQLVSTPYGMGQGHIDEVNHKIRAYLADKDLTGAYFDFSSLLRSLFGDVERKSAHLLARQYHLEGLFPLAMSDKASFARLSEVEKTKLMLGAKAALHTPVKTALVERSFDNLGHVFLAPWVRRRHGLARLWEIEEALQSVALGEAPVPHFLAILDDAYGEGKSVLTKALPSAATGVVAADASIVKDFRLVVTIATTYLYHSGITYPLPQLEQYIQRECGQRWKGFAEGFVERVLRLSPAFILSRGPRAIQVRLA